MFILALMIAVIVIPAVTMIVSEVCDAKWDKQYNADMERRYAAKHERKWGKYAA